MHHITYYYDHIVKKEHFEKHFKIQTNENMKVI